MLVQKSPISPQIYPTSLQKCPVSLRNKTRLCTLRRRTKRKSKGARKCSITATSLICPHWNCIFFEKIPVMHIDEVWCVNECSSQRVLYSRKRALYHLKRALYHCQRALHFWKRGLVCTLTRCGAIKKYDAVCCNVLPMRCSLVQLTCLCVLQCVAGCCMRDATHLMQCVACYWVWAHQIH